MSLFDQFVNAPNIYSIIPFWFLNDTLTEEELKRQIDDFEAHGVYGFIPHARMGLPKEIGFMSEQWLHFIQVCVEHAAAKDMVVILYDEGMYPSGSCAGKVAAENPRYATRCLERRKKGAALKDMEEVIAEDDRWAYVNCRSMGHIRGVHFGTDDGQPGAPASGDLLSPEAMGCFRRLVLGGYYDALGPHFGKTVAAVFTDEPDVLGRGHKKGVKPWTWSFEAFLEEYLGYDLLPHLAALWDDDYPDAARYRDDFGHAVNERLERVYYAPYGQWCKDHGVALTGHPAGPDDIGVLQYFQWPGQDIVWRYIEPFQDKALEGDQSTMGKCSSSAQRHYGRERNINECFGAYGWEFTYQEMRYITNWLFVRGVNCIMPHAFYYSVEGPRRDERPPDVGPNNTWWDSYKPFADYCRRMSWLMANGQHACSFAILGRRDKLPWRAARAMFETQHDFNYLDTETLKAHCTVDGKAVAIRDMVYEAVIVDGAEYTEAEALEALKPLIEAGRVIAFGEAIEGVPRVAANAGELRGLLDGIVRPDIAITPATPHLRYLHLRFNEPEAAEVYVFANEGREPIDVSVKVAAGTPKVWWDPQQGAVLEDQPLDKLTLPPLETRVLVC